MVSTLESGSSGLGLSSARTLCCVLGRHLTLSVSLHQGANLILGVALLWTSIPSRGEQTLVASYYRNKDKLQLDRPLALMQTCLPLPLTKGVLSSKQL